LHRTSVEHRHGRSLRGDLELWIGFAFVAVVGCFFVATELAHRHAARVVGQSRDAAEASLPCVVELARMRGALRELDEMSAPRQRSPPRDEVRALTSALHRLEGGEHASAGALWKHATDELEALMVDEAPLIGDAAGAAGASEGGGGTFHERALAADTALDAIAAFEIERVHRAQAETEAAHNRTRGVAYGLDGLSAMVAGVFATQTIRLHRRQRRAIEVRASELETFAVRVAHDIRSPLTPALYALQRVSIRLAPEDPARGLVDRGLRSIQTIDRTVEGLLAFASARTAPARTQASSVSDVVGAVVAEYYDAAAAVGITLSVERADTSMVACAAGILASILGNLVGNAIKYMGGSEVRRVVVRAVAGGDRVRLEVEDTGPGLPEGAAARVFEAYVRADTSAPGLGLGLATVRRLAVAHGGAAGVLAAKPHGCIFWVDLPVAPSAGDKPRPVSPNVPHA
jgi:signal transduction histidine kinase